MQISVKHRPLKTDLSVWVVLFLLLGFLAPILGSTPPALLANSTPSRFLKPVTIGALPARFGEEFINTAVDYGGCTPVSLERSRVAYILGRRWDQCRSLAG